MRRSLGITLALLALVAGAVSAQLEPSGSGSNTLSGSSSSNTLQPSNAGNNSLGTSANPSNAIEPSGDTVRDINVVEAVDDTPTGSDLSGVLQTLFALLPIAVIALTWFVIAGRAKGDPRKSKKKNRDSSGVSSTADFWDDYNVD